jgi:hypothetical protein
MGTLLKAKFWMLKNAVLRMTYGDVFKTMGFGALGGALLLLLYF